MATLPNLAIAILRLTGHVSVAAVLRYHARRPGRPSQTIMQCEEDFAGTGSHAACRDLTMDVVQVSYTTSL
jgi:hypothetical protein